MKLLLIAVATLVLVLLLRGLLGGNAGRNPPKTRSGGKDKSPEKKIVPCSVCELHIPADEAIHYKNRYFCSLRHLEGWERDTDDTSA